MASINFTIPDVLVVELNQIAQAAGFPNAKAMTIAYFRATIKASRGNKAIKGLREAAEAQADIDTSGVS